MLSMRGIRKRFAGIEVLHGVDFDVRAGEVHALIGHNGAGKSTLMKVLGGVYPEFEGRVEIDGSPADSRTPKEAILRGVATIYQDFALIPDLDVAHNIALGREPSRAGLIPHGRLVERSREEAERFGIRLPMHTLVRELGVAQQQMIEIVRALARDARVLVMDEPTARLAPRERDQLFDLIRRLAAEGVAIIYISHFLDEVLAIADRATILRDGEVVDSGPASGYTTSDLARFLVGDDDVREIVSTRPPIAADAPPLLEVEGLVVHGRPALRLEVRPGEVLALAGLVGSGRTSIARAIVGDLRGAGVVRLGGVPVGRSPVAAAKAGLVLVPEDRKRTGLVLTGTVRENIELTALGGRLSRWGLVAGRRVGEAVAHAIRVLGIRPPSPHRIVGSLSGGNAQKVLVGRAVAAEPRAVIFDQPTAGVDIGAKSDLHREIHELAGRGTSVILISDDLDETLELADRVAVVVGGAIVRELPARALSRADLLAAISMGADQ